MKKLTLSAFSILLAVSLAADVSPSDSPGETPAAQCALANGPATLPPVDLDLWLGQTELQAAQAATPACPVITSCVAPCTASSSCTVTLLGPCCQKPAGFVICCRTGSFKVTTCPCEGASCTGNQVTVGCGILDV
jgi:hypothetical protein